MKPITLYRLLNAAVLCLLVILGLGSKAYSGWGQTWINHFSGDILYEIFWIWLVGAWKVRARSHRIALLIFLLTATIELTQLIPFPAVWKAQLWWRLLLGTTFSWADFFYYAIGCILGGLSLSWLKKQLGLCVLTPPHRPHPQP
ncbi:MAG: DUF2809 domain-containing protein [Phormidesmis sp.]